MTINGVKKCMFVFMLNWIKFAINTVKIIGLKIYFYIYILATRSINVNRHYNRTYCLVFEFMV